MQLYSRRLELRELARSGRPEHFQLQRALGYVTIGLGAAVTGGTLGYVYINSISPDELSLRESRLLWAGVLGGSSLVGLGFWAVAAAYKDNRNRDQIAQVSSEMKSLKRQIKDARRARKRSAQVDVLPELSFGRGTQVGLRLAVRL
ncbi:MAG: hypothetical protein QM778_22305 [Myxococcales bacterium]